MLPSTATGILLFLFIAAPGILFDLLRKRRRPGWPESALQETGRIILASVVFTALSLLLLAGIRIAWPSAMPDVGAWLRDESKYVADNYRLIARTTIVVLFVSLGLAWAADWLLRRRPSGDLRRISAWFALFRAGAPQGALPYARVRLKSGDVYAGYIVYYGEDLPLTDRELVLGAPLVYRPAESNLRELDYRWQRIVVSGSDVEALWVSYIKP